MLHYITNSIIFILCVRAKLENMAFTLRSQWLQTYPLFWSLCMSLCSQERTVYNILARFRRYKFEI